MLQLSNIYYDRPVLSLRTGGVIGHALNPLINPNNLKIEGWYATAQGDRQTFVLLANEVRDIIRKGIVVNDHTSLTHTDDLIRLKDIISLGFEVINKPVITENRKKIGKVQTYAVDDQTMTIKKLYIAQSMFKNFGIQQKIIDRSQIVQITDHEIIIRDATEPVLAARRATQTL